MPKFYGWAPPLRAGTKKVAEAWYFQIWRNWSIHFGPFLDQLMMPYSGGVECYDAIIHFLAHVLGARVCVCPTRICADK